MLAKLQNQDPLNPLENDELIAQISQIREVGATEQLTEILSAVLLGQNIASATNLIGADIDAISDDNQRASGIVSRVSVSGGSPKLHLDLGPQSSARRGARRPPSRHLPIPRCMVRQRRQPIRRRPTGRGQWRVGGDHA